MIASAKSLGTASFGARALRLGAIVGGVIGLGAALVAVLAPSARADAGAGSIEFTLTNWFDDSAASGGCMEVYDASEAMVGSDCVGAAGAYTVAGLADGEYRVKLANFANAAAGQWYSLGNSFATATAVSVEGGAAFLDQYELVVPFSVIGRVVDPSGNPLGGGRIELWDSSSPHPGPVASVDVRADGTFATGDARVQGWTLLRYAGFPGYANEWYHDIYWAPSWSDIGLLETRPFLVQTETMNLSEGVLTGAISVPANFTSDSACIYLYEMDATTAWHLGTECGTVGATFEFRNLYPRTYAICVADEAVPTDTCWGAGREFRVYGGNSVADALDNGNGFVVAEGAATTATLVWGGAVTSTPTVPPGASPATGCMEVWRAGLTPILEGSDCAAVDGTYSVSGLDDRASHLVGFRDFNGFFDEWYADADSMVQATPVSVGFGETLVLSVALSPAPAPWGTISGDITLPAGSSDDHACVGVTDGDTFSDHVCTVPGETGYVISVPPRPVWLEFYTETPATAFQLYNNVAAPADATSVNVALGANQGIDATLATAAEISGDVTLSDGAVALDGCVEAYEPDGNYVYARCVDSSGHYVLDSLPAGDYHLFFTGFTGAGVDEFYGGTVDLGAATTITVVPGDAKVADMVLPRPGAISGTVTRPDGGPAMGGCAVAYSVSGGDPVRVSEGCVDASGRYSLQLPVGDYAILFADFHDTAGGALQDEWNADAATSEAAATVTVGDNGLATVNASLASSVTTLSATLRSWALWPAKGGCSRVYNDDYALVTERCNGATNTWTAAIPAGTYHVQFVGYWYALDSVAHSLATQWAHQEATFRDSDDIVVSAGVTTSAYFTLATGVTFRGTVIVPSGATSDGWVGFYDYTTGGLDYWTSVAPDGTYSIPGVVGGPHRVRFAGFTGAADEWYNNARSFGSAGWVGSGGDGTTETLNATLAPEAVLTGTMSVPSDFTDTYACVTAYYSDGYPVGEACAAVGQPFAIHNLPAGTIRLDFSDSTHNRLYRTDDWYSAIAFTLSAGVTTNAAIAWAVPTVTSVSPGFGPEVGGTTVTITGSGFTGATGVTFDGVAGTGLSVVSDTALTVVTPAGTDLRAPIVVANAVWDSDPADAAFFAYTDSLVVAGVPQNIEDVSGFTQGVVRCYQVTGRAGVPVGADGVILNVTASLPNGVGHVRVYPDYMNNGASPAPLVSTVNFEVNRDVANSTTVALPANGKVCAYSVGGTMSRFLLDVMGYTVPGSGVVLTTPEKLIDTRAAPWPHTGPIVGPVEPLTDYTVQVTGNAGVPVGATAVMVNITVVDTRSPGHLRMWEAGTPMPDTSVINYAPETKANSQIVALSPDGQLTFRSMSWVSASRSPVQVLIDVTGYIEAGSDFVATTPTKVVETRPYYGVVGPITSPLVPMTVYPVPIDDSVVPLTATAVVLNVTMTNTTAVGHLRVYPDTNGLGTTPPPVMSNINYIVGRDIPNMVVVQLPPDRTINFYSVQAATGRTDMVANIIGYIEGTT